MNNQNCIETVRLKRPLPQVIILFETLQERKQIVIGLADGCKYLGCLKPLCEAMSESTPYTDWGTDGDVDPLAAMSDCELPARRCTGVLLAHYSTPPHWMIGGRPGRPIRRPWMPCQGHRQPEAAHSTGSLPHSHCLASGALRSALRLAAASTRTRACLGLAPGCLACHDVHGCTVIGRLRAPVRLGRCPCEWE